jgi:hypothetical protein
MGLENGGFKWVSENKNAKLRITMTDLQNPKLVLVIEYYCVGDIICQAHLEPFSR